VSEIGTDNTGDHTLLIPGTRLEYTALPVNSRLGFQVDYWCRPHDTFAHCYKGATTGVFLSLGGKLNASFTQIPGGLTEYRNRNSTILTVSAGDLNGLAYWAARFLRS
jgi:hypothetical protein